MSQSRLVFWKKGDGYYFMILVAEPSEKVTM